MSLKSERKILDTVDKSKNTVQILDSFTITGLGIICEVQHNLNGIPPETQLIDKITEEIWVVKKRVLHGILILEESEHYFDCETATMHADFTFKDVETRKKFEQKELEKRKRGIYSYLLKPIHKKQKEKPAKDSILTVKIN